MTTATQGATQPKTTLMQQHSASKSRRQHSVLLGAVLAAVAGLATTQLVFLVCGQPVGLRASMISGLDSVRRQTSPNPMQQPSNDWRMNVGKAIDVLREDIPALLATGDNSRGHLPDFSIFSDDVAFVDARAPALEMRSLATYQQFLSALRWSVETACDESRLVITATQPPVNGEVLFRWRLHLWPKDVMSYAKDLLGGHVHHHVGQGMPSIVEGYSRYEFDPWSAQIVKHTIDITNPPMYITDLLWKQMPSQTWVPAQTGLRLPNIMHTGVPSQEVVSPQPGAFAGASLPMEKPQSRAAAFSRIVRAAGWSVPQRCEDDFECNGGRANFPLQCCELPLLGNFCCEPPERQEHYDRRDPAWVPLPVPVDPLS